MEEHTGAVQIVDLRNSKARSAISPGTKLLALNRLASNTGELNLDQPIVTVCRAGTRSAQAATILKKAGLTKVASLAGGMLRACRIAASGSRLGLVNAGD